MDRRIIKQIVIGLISLLVLSGLVFFVYWLFKPAPSCFDGVQNQGERGVDCGGPCLSCDELKLEDVEVLWLEAVIGQNGFYDLAARIRNPNQNYGTGELPYRFELFDDRNNLIGHYDGRTFILPNQTKYLVQIKVPSQGIVKRVALAFGEIKWLKLSDYQPPQLVINNKEYHLLGNAGLGYGQARAVLINKSSFDYENVEVDILLFDKSDNLIALNRTEVNALLSDQERDFTVTWFKEIIGQVALVEIEAETNIFDPNNFLSTKGEVPDRFQEY